MAETLNLFTSFFEFEAEISINVVRRSDVAFSLSRSGNVNRVNGGILGNGDGYYKFPK